MQRWASITSPWALRYISPITNITEHHGDSICIPSSTLSALLPLGFG